AVESGRPVCKRLCQGLNHPGADMRRLCATALGWAGHRQAAAPLVKLLNDPAPSVRLAAVAALCQIGDAEVAGRLKQMLASGTTAEKRAVLLNLWRLEEKGGSLHEIYRNYACHPDADLKLVALALLEPVDANNNAPLFMAGLCDKDSRVRRLCLERLMRQGRQYLPQAIESLRALLDDRRMDIKRAALNALKIAEEEAIHP
ncbi:MAG: HEAT repeat domain-containing protein, partial [Desulfatibacillaceae bacterium]|nr:HEAT repeat domain-containing protein [Desulfatibacillaceae bacterium]